MVNSKEVCTSCHGPKTRKAALCKACRYPRTQTKLCNGPCGQTLPISDFGIKNDRPKSRCFSCEASARRAYSKTLTLEQKQKRNQVNRQWWKNNPEKGRVLTSREKIKKLGLQAEETRILYDMANQTRCLICNCFPTSGKNLSIDHDHSSGEYRGLICNECNLGLGLAKDSPELLENMASYLATHIQAAREVLAACPKET